MARSLSGFQVVLYLKVSGSKRWPLLILNHHQIKAATTAIISPNLVSL